MLKKRYRFSFQEGVPKKITASPLFVLRYQKNDAGELRLAIVVSKKVDKRATKRNELKRVIKSVIEDSVDLNSSVSMVFYLKKAAAEVEQDTLKNEVRKTLGVIKE